MKNLKSLSILILFFISLCCWSQNDCVNNIIVCGNTGYNGLTATGFGVQELNNSNTCGSIENNSIWLKISFNTSGTFGFDLIPENTGIDVDFDFFIFGPNVTCGNIGPSIRCSTTNPEAAHSTSNHTGMNSTETDTSEGPGSSGNNYVQWLTVNAGEVYYIVIDRPVGTSNFSLQWSGNATFNAPPIFNSIKDFKQCDSDGIHDSATLFDLTQNTPLIIGSQVNVSVTYHLNENDAITGMNAIANPQAFLNTISPQIIYTRITNTTTGCFNTSNFKIEIQKDLVFPYTKSELCDDLSDGDDTNGKSTFDLDAVTSDIFNNQDTSTYTIHYYLSQFDADHDLNPLPRFFYNTVPNQQSIFIKASSPIACVATSEIFLIVKTVPAKITANLTQCDSGLNPDGITLFNLNEATAFFTTNNANLSVAYFLNSNDEVLNHALSSNFTNTTNPQSLVVRVTNSTTGCSSLSTLILNVNVVPGQHVSAIEECDILNQENGFTTFNLNNTPIVISTNQTVAYYTNLNDALLEQNKITNLAAYPNVIAYNSIIYARIEDSNNNCSGISEVPLIVNRLPNIDILSTDNYLCYNIANNYITINASIREGSIGDYTYKWYLDGILIPKTTYSILVNQTGTYTVEVTNSSHCTKTRTIIVKQSSLATFDTIVIDDVFTDNNTVTINLNSTSSLGSYEYSIDAPNGPFQSSNHFEYVANGFHYVYVKDLFGCGIVKKKIAVIGIPKFFTPNGDGYNDIWKIEGVDSFFNSETKITIFDRFGKLIKSIPLKDTRGWDGTYNGQLMPSDDYWYAIQLEDGRNVKGHFSLIR